MEKIDMKDIRIEVLSPSHKDIIKNFNSYEMDLVDFLIDDALQNQNNKISVTYLWFKRDTNELVAYITLLCDSLRLSNVMKNYFRTKNILYKSLPAIKIGRLCVDDRYLKRGIGTLMVEFAISKVTQLNKDSGVGCRFLTIDAKHNLDHPKDSQHFYRKKGFSVLKERVKGTTPMYKDIYKILEYSSTQ